MWLKALTLGVALTGCSLGPVEITHRAGELPKIHVNLPTEECKLRAKYPEDEVYIHCKWEYEL